MDWSKRTEEIAEESKERGRAEGRAEGIAEGKERGIEEGRLEVIVNVLTAIKQRGPEACKEFAKKNLKATDIEIAKALNKIFETTEKE